MQSISLNKLVKAIQINIILLLTISSCVSTKVTDEFNSKKENKILLVIDKASEVEKKKEIGLLFTRYLDAVPSDEILLRTVNEYVPYELYNLGYKNVIYKEDLEKTKDNLAQFDFIAEIKLKDFQVKEYKFKEQVSDSASGKTDAVKLHGVKTKLEASLFSLSSKSGDNYGKNASASTSDDESQEGCFKNTVGVKDLINKNYDGSIKYKHTVTPLANGLFENQCTSVSYKLAKDISDKLLLVYKNEMKDKNKKKKIG